MENYVLPAERRTMRQNSIAPKHKPSTRRKYNPTQGAAEIADRLIAA